MFQLPIRAVASAARPVAVVGVGLRTRANGQTTGMRKINRANRRMCGTPKQTTHTGGNRRRCTLELMGPPVNPGEERVWNRRAQGFSPLLDTPPPPVRMALDLPPARISGKFGHEMQQVSESGHAAHHRNRERGTG